MNLKDLSDWQHTSTFLCVDLGKLQDYTAISIINGIERFEVLHDPATRSYCPGRGRPEKCGLKCRIFTGSQLERITLHKCGSSSGSMSNWGGNVSPAPSLLSTQPAWGNP